MQNWLDLEVELQPLTINLIRFGICLENKELDIVINFVLCFGMDGLSLNPTLISG